jgi:release factor glutamine methyltransferase
MPTLRDVVKQAESHLISGPHPNRARLDAETLLLHTLGKSRALLLAHWNDAADPDQQHTFSSLIARRLTGEPIQYITGHAEFYGLPFAVAPGVLIPRPETEHLVEEAIRLAAAFPAPRIADIGTGSGAIAVALAHAIPSAHIVATDISPAALSIARSNAERNHLADRIAFLEGDLLSPLAGQRFDLLASNPPYIPLSDLPSLSIEVRDHEPASALFAGADGLDIYRHLIPAAPAHLNPGGWLLLEIGFGQQPVIEAILAASNFTEIRFIPDYQGIPRVAVARLMNPQ